MFNLSKNNLVREVALFASFCTASVGSAIGLAAFRAANSDQARLNKAQTALVNGFNEEGLLWNRKVAKEGTTTFTATSNEGLQVTLELSKRGAHDVVSVQVSENDGGRMFSFSKCRKDLIPGREQPIHDLIKYALRSSPASDRESASQRIGQ